MEGRPPEHDQYGEPRRYAAELLITQELDNMLAAAYRSSLDTPVAEEAAIVTEEPLADEIAGVADEEPVTATRSGTEAIVVESQPVEPASMPPQSGPLIARKSAVPQPESEPVTLLLSPAIPPSMMPVPREPVSGTEVAEHSSQDQTGTAGVSAAGQHAPVQGLNTSSEKKEDEQEKPLQLRVKVHFGQLDKHTEFIEVVGSAAARLLQKKKKEKDENSAAAVPCKSGPPKQPILVPGKTASEPGPQVPDAPDANENATDLARPLPATVNNFDDKESGGVTLHQLQLINMLDEQGIRLDRHVMAESDEAPFFTDMRILDALKSVCLDEERPESYEANAADAITEVLEQEQKRLLGAYRDLAKALCEDAAAKRSQPRGLRRVTSFLMPSDSQDSIATEYIKRQQLQLSQDHPNIDPEALKPDRIIASKTEGLRRDLSLESFLVDHDQTDRLIVWSRYRKHYFSGRPSNQLLLAADGTYTALVVKYRDAQFLLESTAYEDADDQEREILAVRPLKAAEYSRLVSGIEFLMAQAGSK